MHAVAKLLNSFGDIIDNVLLKIFLTLKPPMKANYWKLQEDQIYTCNEDFITSRFNPYLMNLAQRIEHWRSN